MVVASQTQYCISVSAKPGRLGTTVHNAGYQALGLDFSYKAFATDDIEGVIAGVRALGIRGCSVSMPFKEKVLAYLDELDPVAASVGAVNTIVNTNKKLIGYNTDVIGVRESLRKFITDKAESVLVLGTGGASRAVLKALQDLGMTNVFLCGRSFAKTEVLAKEFKVRPAQWEERNKFNGILMNATSIGMSNADLPIDANSINQFRVILDMVAALPLSKFLQLAQQQKINIVSGLDIALEQAYAQFELYTGKPAPRAVMQAAAKKLS